MEKQLDFLAIGDITTDAFIRLKEAEVHCNLDKTSCQLCMRFADKIPYEFVEVVRAVGNSPNASVCASRLGLSSGLITDIGDDENGAECVEVLKKEKVDTSFVKIHKDIPTNYHYVLWFQDERTILVKHQKYPYSMPEIFPPKWIYLSSLGGDSLSYHDEIAKYLEENPDVKMAFQPGTFQISFGAEKLARIYKETDIFFCNVEEARKILSLETKTTENSTEDLKLLLDRLHALGPKTVCITDGPKGAYAYDSEKKEYLFQPPYPDPKPPLNRTGAGDAFAATFTSAIILGKSISEALALAPINSAFVVQQVGAQKGLLAREEIFKLLRDAPADFKTKNI